MAGVSRACGWSVESLWLECREPVAGVSRACGWSVESLWLECREPVAGVSRACGWSVESLWLTEAYCDAMAGGSLLEVAF